MLLNINFFGLLISDTVTLVGITHPNRPPLPLLLRFLLMEQPQLVTPPNILPCLLQLDPSKVAILPILRPKLHLMVSPNANIVLFIKNSNFVK